MDNYLLTLQNYITIYGLKILGSVLILIIGLWLAKLIAANISKHLIKKNTDPTLVKFLSSLVRFTLITFVVIAAISQAGVETTSFIAVLGAAGLAVGLALQGSLSNFASGVMLIIFRPIKVGDYIEGGGNQGIVEEIGIFVTTLLSLDNKQIFVPNAKLTADNIVNYSGKEIRRVDLVFGVGYKEDIDNIRKIIIEALNKNSKIIGEPKPDILVSKLADSSVNFEVRPWCKTSDYWDVYYSVTEDVKKKFVEHAIKVPYPQREVHLNQN
ncbi:MAG: mechanosensitive ion channel [Ignavibacteriales bacterium]|nr:mechanosensitive ion channel [Ignavibacteriales bacterium]